MNEASALSDIVSGIAASVVAIVAVHGLTTWKAQLHGTAEYDLARRVLRAVLRVRDEIAIVRSPLVTAGEMASARESAGEERAPDEDTERRRGYELAYDVRWRRLSGALSDLQTELLESEVLWGAQSVAPGNALRRCVSRLAVALRHHLRAQKHPPKRPRDLEILENQELVLWAGGDGESGDAFEAEVLAIVTEFESFLRPKIQHRS